MLKFVKKNLTDEYKSVLYSKLYVEFLHFEVPQMGKCQTMLELNQMQQSLALTHDELRAGTQQREQNCYHCHP